MCRGPVGGTGVYIPPFLLIDEDADSASQGRSPTGDLTTKQPHQSGFVAPQAPSTRPPASRWHSCCGGSYNGGRVVTPEPRSPDWQTFQPAGACSPGSSYSTSSTCAGWDLTFAPPCPSGGTFGSSPMPAPLCGFQAGAVPQMAAQGPVYPEDDMDEIDCRLQQLLARKQALLQARAAAAGAAQGPSIAMPGTPPQPAQAVMPQQLAASQAMCGSATFCFSSGPLGSEALLGGLACCSGDALVLGGPCNNPPPPAPAGFCMLSNLPSASLAPCMPAGLASPAAAVPLACGALPPGVQQVYRSSMAQDKLLELSQMQHLEAALTDDLLQLLPIF